MATNRYIGARYVPIFAGDWDNTQEYEPLTIVSYQGDSYTSRGYVPTGINITNTQYWAKTGNFNQQVANLSGQVDYLNGKMQDCEEAIDDIEGDINELNTGLNTWIDNRTDTVIGNNKMKETSAWFYTFNVVATKQLNSGESGQVEVDVTNYLTDGDFSYYMIGVAGFSANGVDYIDGIELSNNSKLVRVDLHNNTDQAHEVGGTVTVQCINRHLIPTA